MIFCFPGYISVLATDDISVNIMSVSGDQCNSYLPLPLQVLDKEYYIVTMPPNDPTNNKAYAIVSTFEDENTITATWGGKANAAVSWCGGSGTITGTSSFSVERHDPCWIVAQGTLTGTKLTGTKTFSVVMGTYNTKYDGADPPVNGVSDDSGMMAVKASAWGTRFAIPKIPDGTAAGYDIVVFGLTANSKYRLVTTVAGGTTSSVEYSLSSNLRVHDLALNQHVYIDSDEQVHHDNIMTFYRLDYLNEAVLLC